MLFRNGGKFENREGFLIAVVILQGFNSHRAIPFVRLQSFTEMNALALVINKY